MLGSVRWDKSLIRPRSVNDPWPKCLIQSNAAWYSYRSPTEMLMWGHQQKDEMLVWGHQQKRFMFSVRSVTPNFHWIGRSSARSSAQLQVPLGAFQQDLQGHTRTARPCENHEITWSFVDVKREQKKPNKVTLPVQSWLAATLSVRSWLAVDLVIFPRFLCFYHELVGYIVNVFFVCLV